MILDELLGDRSREEFLERHFLKLPFSVPGGAARFRSLGTRETLRSLLSQPGIDAMAAIEGRRWNDGRTPAPSEVDELHRQGHTLLVRHAERSDEALRRLAEAFAAEFLAPVDVHLYVTPAEAQGFGWHYDVEDVFILQTEGVKEYSLRKNTVNPWPLLETLPTDMRYEREIMPRMHCRLEPGDWLYLPHGYWHCARAVSDSISLSVGVLMPAAITLLDTLRTALRESILWRQRLPAPHRGEIRPADHEALFDQLADDVAAVLRSEGFREAVADARRTAHEK